MIVIILSPIKINRVMNKFPVKIINNKIVPHLNLLQILIIQIIKTKNNV
jgi:hypothetical protein